MKNYLFFLFIIVVILSFTSCTEKAAEIKTNESIIKIEEKEFNNESSTQNSEKSSVSSDVHFTEIPDVNSNDTLEMKMPLNEWVSEKGIYSIDIFPTGNDNDRFKDSKKDYSLIKITDHITGKKMVLCSKPNCSHENPECEAFFPGKNYGKKNMEGLSEGLTSATIPCLFMSDGYLYVYNLDALYRMNPDGSNRIEVMKIPDKYKLHENGWIYKGKWYQTMLVYTGTQNNFSVELCTLLEIDFKKRSYKELWQLEYFGEDSGTNILGFWNGIHYFCELKQKSPPGTSNQKLLDQWENSGKVKIYSINSISGKKKMIIENSSYEIDSTTIKIINPLEIIYHSRSERALIKLDLSTGEKTNLDKTPPGYIKIGEEFEGRIFIYKDNSRNHVELNYTPEDELLIYELETGKLIECAFTVKKNIQGKGICEILYEEDGYYYIPIERELKWKEPEPGSIGCAEFIRGRLGKIKKEDFWGNRVEKIEKLEWYDENEWYEKFGTKGSGGTIQTKWDFE